MEHLDRGDAIVASARACLGWTFRAQGRGSDGIDCLGLVLVALRPVGRTFEVPAGYRLVGHHRDTVLRQLEANGLDAIGPALARPGDVLVRFPSGRQVHFGVRTDAGVIEADYALGRVVERPGWPDDRWVAAFRPD